MHLVLYGEEGAEKIQDNLCSQKNYMVFVVMLYYFFVLVDSDCRCSFGCHHAKEYTSLFSMIDD